MEQEERFMIVKIGREHYGIKINDVKEVDVPAIDVKDITTFKEVLAVKSFWFTGELENRG